MLLAIIASGILLAQTPSPKGSIPSAASQPFGLKGDTLGETLEEFLARNDRVIALGDNGLMHLSFAPLLPKTKHLPQCTNDRVPEYEHLSPDVAKSKLTEEQARAGVVKCIAALSLNDDLDFDDRPTVAGIRAYRTVYSFFRNRLYKIESELPDNSYPELHAAFVAKYGTPRAVAIAHYQNGFGARAIGQQLGWKNAVSQINIGQLDAKQHADPFGDEMAALDERIRSTKVQTEALGLSPEAELVARAYDKSIKKIKEINKALEGHNKVLLTIWHNALHKECETAGTLKGREKDL